MPLPNLNALRMFDAAARHLNFRLAAEELHVTQGAVAQQVRNLEADLNHRLFTRLPRGLALTQTGAAYHTDIHRALEVIETATANLSPAASALTLSLPPSLAAKWLVPRLAGFADEHPEITLSTHASAEVTDFRRDGIDLAIRQGLAPKDTGLTCHALAPLELVAVASPAYLATTSQVQTLPDLTDHKLIEDSHGHWKNLMKDNNLPPPATSLTFNQTALAIDAATNGQGIAIAPQLLLQDAITQGLLQVVWTPPENGEGFHILHPSTRHPARDIVVAWLAKQIPPGSPKTLG